MTCINHPNFIENIKKTVERNILGKVKRIEEYDKSPKRCINCEKSLSYEKRRNKFCSKTCAASYNNKDRVISKKDVKTHCLECGKKLDRTIKRQTKFCSYLCSNKYRSKKYEEKLISNVDCIKTTNQSTLKKIIIRRDGNKCSICSLPEEWEFKPIIMILDHIDGNSSNNDPNNLRLVCPNCDSQLPTYKGRNKGNGRYERRKRYQEGKSF